MSAMDDNIVVSGFSWADDIDDYLRLTQGWRAGVIPVISPPQSYRRERWSGILNWYWMGEADTLRVTPFQGQVSDHANPVFVCDREFLPPLQLYASFSGRPCFLVESDAQIYDICGSHSCDSALIVDKPGRLTFNRVFGFNEKLHVPWGIVTAIDLPGLTFVVAKLIAGYHASGNSFCSIDMLGRELRVFGDESFIPQVYEPLQEYLLEVTGQWDWHGVAIMAHGDSAHTYLESVVLCGLPGIQEHGMDGLPIYGCRDGSHNERNCKRAATLGAAITYFREIRTTEVYLFTCTGFCASGQQYPSEVSSVLALSEGYAHTILTTDGLIPIYRFSDYIAFRLRSKGVRPGYMQTLFNDLASRRSMRTPYILWGDPRWSDPGWNAPDSEGLLRSSSGDAVLGVKLEGLGPAPILELEGAEPETQLLRGEHHAVILRPVGALGTVYRLRDATHRWTDHWTGLQSALKRVGRAAWLERALRGLLEDYLGESPGLSDRVTELMSLRLHLEFAVQSALNLCQSLHRQGIYEGKLEQASHIVAEHMGRWDRMFCEIVLEHLLSERYDRLLSDGCAEHQLIESGTCSRCGSAVFEKSMSHPADESWLIDERHCPICGYLGAGSSKAGRLHVEIPASVSPGQLLEIALSLDAGEEDMWTARLNGEIAVKAHDGWCMSVFLATVETVAAWPHRFSVVVPHEMPLELMSLNFCCSRALDVRFARIRCAAVPDRTADTSSRSREKESGRNFL